jgi:hypothetical protein
MPPSTPVPSHRIQSWWVTMPKAPSSRPPDQQTAAATPALRGPARSSQPPHSAAATPRKKMNRVNTQLRSATSQSQLVVNRAVKMDDPAGQASGLLPPISCDSGSQNTLKP